MLSAKRVCPMSSTRWHEVEPPRRRSATAAEPRVRLGRRAEELPLQGDELPRHGVELGADERDRLRLGEADEREERLLVAARPASELARARRREDRRHLRGMPREDGRP